MLTQSTTYTANSKRYLRFAAVLSVVFSLGILAVNFNRQATSWTTNSLTFSLIHLALSLANAWVTYTILKQANQHKTVISADNKIRPDETTSLATIPAWHRPLGALLMFSVLLGNPFNFISGVLLLFRKVQAYQYYLLFSVLVDLTILAISLINLTKPTLNPQFSFGIGLLVTS